MKTNWYLFLLVIGLSFNGIILSGFDGCAVLHLDKNYVISGESLHGALHTVRCNTISPQVEVALLNLENEILCKTWVLLDSALEPFKLEIPGNTPDGVYKLVTYTKNDHQIIYAADLLVINWGTRINFTENSGEISNGDFLNTSKGLSVSLNKTRVNSAEYLDIEISAEVSDLLPLLVSLKVTDKAQTYQVGPALDVEEGLKRAPNAPATLTASSYTFPFKGYLKDSIGNGCNYCLIVLTIPEVVEGIFYTRTDDSGFFEFTGMAHSGIKKGYLWYPAGTSKLPMSFTISKSSSPALIPPVETEFEHIKKSLLSQLKRKLIAMNIRDVNSVIQEAVKTPRNYEQIVLLPKKDLQVLFDQYHLGPDIRETFKSIVPNVNFIRKDQVRVFSFENRKNFPDTPLILLDGIPISNSELLKIDPRTVYKVEVVHKTRSLSQVGNLAANGLISVVTKSGTDHTKFPGIERVFIQGFDNPPDDEIIFNSNQPLSHVLYWDPVLEINNQEPVRVRVMMPNYYVEPVLSIYGFDNQRNVVFYEKDIVHQ